MISNQYIAAIRWRWTNFIVVFRPLWPEFRGNQMVGTAGIDFQCPDHWRRRRLSISLCWRGSWRTYSWGDLR